MHHGDVSPELAQGLLALKDIINKSEIPSSKLDETINVAIWNIREFGKKNRKPEAIHYIAEILGQFDLIAIVELRDNIEDLCKTLPILGPSWNIVYSDWIEDSGGNKERTAFLYDRRAVTFNGLAAEVDAPRKKINAEYLASLSFWRAPYMCSFRAGNFDFVAIATHARWGDGIEGRKAELQMLSDWIKLRYTSKHIEDTDIVVMGDFNTPKIGDDLFKALTSCGLMVPDALVELKEGSQTIGGSNLGNDMRYDQILHMPSMKKRFTNRAGTLDFFQKGKSIEKLFPGKKYSKLEFSFQLSDHFPVWVQINTNIDGERFKQIVQNDRKE